MALIEISREELDAIKAKIKAAREDADKQRQIRKKCQDAYYRLPLGNEKEGRSQIIDSSVYNHVAGTHPHLMRRFVATDQKIGIRGPDPMIARALKQAIRDDLKEQGGFELIDTVLKDGEISHNGTAKQWWTRVWGQSSMQSIEVNLEQLQKLAEDVQFEFTEADIMPLPLRKAVVDDGVFDPRTGATTPILVKGAQMYRVNLKFTPLIESGLRMQAMPPEEFIVERGKAKMNDRRGCGHLRKMMAGELERDNERLSADGSPYYRNLKLATESSPNFQMSQEDQARREREELFWTESSISSQRGLSDSDLRKEVEVVEWYDWVVKSGKFVPAIITLGNDTLLRCEDNEDGVILMSTWSPIPSPHSVIGQSLAWLHVDSQNVRTTLTRALMDNVAESVDVPLIVRNRGVDILGLQNRKPGSIVIGNPDDVVAMPAGQLDYRLFQVLEYLKAEGEERGPGTRFNQGTDGGPGANTTATGISIVQRASFNKIDLIAMSFSECFLVDLYNKAIILYQRNLDKPRIVVVDGVPVQLEKDDIQGRYTAFADLGMEVDFDDRAFAKDMTVLKMATELGMSGIYPFSPESVQEYLKDVLISAGKRDPTKYMQKVGQQVTPPGAPPQAQPGQPPTPSNERPGAAGAMAGEKAMPNAGMMPTPFGGDQTLAGGADEPGAGMGAGE